MRMHMLILVAVLGLTCSGVATASADSEKVDLDAIRTQQTELRAQVLAGDDFYGEMNKRDREKLVDTQTDLLELLKGKTSFDALSEREQLEAFNSLELIKGMVNNAEDQRMICYSRSRTGSHRKTTICKTAAERRQDREDSRRKLRINHQGSFCATAKACGDV